MINFRRAFEGGHVEDFDDLVIEAKFHARGFGAGLLAEGFGAQGVFARGGEFRRRADFALGVERAAGIAEDAAGGSGRELGGGDAFGRAAVGGRGGEGGAQNLVRGGGVFLEQDRREGEDVADVVEAVAGIVGGKIIGGLELHADEVADAVVVFGAVEAADGDAARVGIGAVGVEDFALDPGGEEVAFGLRGLGFVRRRHLAAAEVRHHFFPRLAILADGGGVLENLEGQVALLFRVAVAVVAIAREDGFDLRLEGGRAAGAFGGLRLARRVSRQAVLEAEADDQQRRDGRDAGAGDEQRGRPFAGGPTRGRSRGQGGEIGRCRGQGHARRWLTVGGRGDGSLVGDGQVRSAGGAGDLHPRRLVFGLETLTATGAIELHFGNLIRISDAREGTLVAPFVNAKLGQEMRDQKLGIRNGGKEESEGEGISDYWNGNWWGNPLGRLSPDP